MTRDYNPALGRYIESDSLGLFAGINTYAFVHSNPLTRIDRLGLQGEDPYSCPNLCKIAQDELIESLD
jgi:uncharacterized protein RhaS with RHS repeats